MSGSLGVRKMQRGKAVTVHAMMEVNGQLKAPAALSPIKKED